MKNMLKQKPHEGNEFFYFYDVIFRLDIVHIGYKNHNFIGLL